MDPTLDDCNELLDWLEEQFDLDRKLRIRIRELNGVHFVQLSWNRAKRPEAHELYPPKGWLIERWLIDEDGVWQSALYREDRSSDEEDD